MPEQIELGQSDPNALKQYLPIITEQLSETLMLSDFLKILEVYKIKCRARGCSNFYYDTKEDKEYQRKETVAEHVASTLKLADFFFNEDEFKDLDRLKVYELIMYHDDIEIETEDVSISDEEGKKTKGKNEDEALPILAGKYPPKMDERLISLITEYREWKTPEAKFASAVDKMDALVHELPYPQDRGPKWFTKEKVIKWFQPSFEYSPTFMKYFWMVVAFLEKNLYFEELI